MVTRDEDDPRNEEEGEMNCRGERLVVMGELQNGAAIVAFMYEMKSPGSHMYDELQKLKVRRGCRALGDYDGGNLFVLDATLGMSLLPADRCACCLIPACSTCHAEERRAGQAAVRMVQADLQGEEGLLRQGSHERILSSWRW